VSPAGICLRFQPRLAIKSALLAVFSTWALYSQGNPAPRQRIAPEYEVKAAFLLNFARFVEWPSFGEVPSSAPFSICILGDDPFGQTLDQIVRGEKIDNRPLAVRRVRRPQDQCQVLFVPASESDVARILKEVGPGVLTVGEAPDFLRNGGMIDFVVENRRVRFDVNRAAAERASLRISSRLLGVARSVVK
jgi:YfiR/HmsC-like